MESGGPGPGPVAPAGELRRAIGFWGAVAILVGSTIGSGIFRAPYSISLQVQDPRLILALWVAFGVISLCGALTLAELASMMPKTGGTYVYLRAAYGEPAAFVFGWLYLLAAIPSGMGALGAAFGDTLAGFLPGKPPDAFVPAVAITCVVVLSTVNILGVRSGSTVQNVFTGAKVAALLFVMGTILVCGVRWTMGVERPLSATGPVGIAAAVALVMFTYNGWVYVALVAGEVESAERRIRKVIIVGILTVIALYVGANVAYLSFMDVDAMARSEDKIIPRAIVKILLGPGAATAVGICVLASILGSLNGVILTKSRVAFALARDGLSFAPLGKCHARWATPYVSIIAQGVAAMALICWLRSFDKLISYFVLVEWLALVFAIGAVFVLRSQMPDVPRPFRTPGYPWVPLVFVVGTTLALGAIVWGKLSSGDRSPLVGLGIIAAGFPVYWIWRRSASRVR